jgi:hypothetical protein
MADILKNIEKLLAKKDVLPSDFLIEQMKNITENKAPIDDLVLDGAEKISKMSGLTAEQKKSFIQNLVTNPTTIFAYETIQKFEGTELVIVSNHKFSSGKTETKTRTYKVVNKERQFHGARTLEYSNGDRTDETWENGKMISKTEYENGLTTHRKYDQNGSMVEKKYGSFDHLPRKGQKEPTKFMRFQQELQMEIEKSLKAGYKQACIHDLSNAELFHEWTKDFAKSNHYTITGDNRHIAW